MARSNNGTLGPFFTAASCPVPSIPFTIACWFKTSSTSPFQTIFLFASPTIADYYALWLGVDFPGYVESTAVTGNANRGLAVAKSPTTYPLDQWNHAAAVFSATNNRVTYLNGQAGTPNTWDVTPSGVNRLDLTGFNPSGTGPLNGSLAECAMWNCALSAKDIGLLSSGAVPLQIRPDQLRAYWPMTGLNYADEPDILGGYPLTLTGAMGVDQSQQLLSRYLLHPRFTPTLSTTILSSSFSSVGSTSFEAIGRSTARAEFSANGDSQASFIRFIPKVIPAPSRITPGATVTLTLHSQGTHWTMVTPILSAPGITFSDLTVISDTTVTVTAAVSTTPQLSVITDVTTGGVCNLLIKRPTAWVPPRHR